jgi:hypothetical protein
MNELQHWSTIWTMMLKGILVRLKKKDICNFVPLIEVFMQEWFLGEETPK